MYLRFIFLLSTLLLSDSLRAQNEEYRILFGGDMHFGHTYQKRYAELGQTNINEHHGYEYPFRYLDPFLDHANHVILNLESPITDEEESVFTEKPYLHKEPRKKLAEIFVAKKIHAVSLANNHFIDFGKKGINDSLRFLKKSRVDFFGAGKNRKEAQAPHFHRFTLDGEEISLAVLGSFEYRSSYEIDFDAYASKNNSGVNRLSARNVSAMVERIRNENPNTKIILYPHWGNNYVWASKGQKETASKCLDCGADMIVGHGAHMIQDIDVIKNKLSVFSLGNFIFNTNGRYHQKKGVGYSHIVYLVYKKVDGVLCPSMKVYPLYCDNKVTFWQPRPVEEHDFESHYLPLMREHSEPCIDTFATSGKDALGYFLNIELKHDLSLASRD